MSTFTKDSIGYLVLVCVLLTALSASFMIKSLSPSGMGSSNLYSQSNFCYVHAIRVNPIPNVSLNFGDQFNYRVTINNTNNASATFSDDTRLFDINNVTGVINYTATQAGYGYHNITITVSLPESFCPNFVFQTLSPQSSSRFEWSSSFSMNITGNITPPSPPSPRGGGGGGSHGAGIQDVALIQVPPVVPERTAPDTSDKSDDNYLSDRKTQAFYGSEGGVSRGVDSPMSWSDYAKTPVFWVEKGILNPLVSIALILLILLIVAFIVYKSVSGGKPSKRRRKRKK